MGKYIIYHIPGKKVGCTANLTQRYASNTQISMESIEILETVTGTSEQAGDREWEWADRFGYPRHTHYKYVASGSTYKDDIRGSTVRSSCRSIPRQKRKTKITSIAFTREQAKELEMLAERHDWTISKAVREAVKLLMAAEKNVAA